MASILECEHSITRRGASRQARIRYFGTVRRDRGNAEDRFRPEWLRPIGSLGRRLRPRTTGGHGRIWPPEQIPFEELLPMLQPSDVFDEAASCNPWRRDRSRRTIDPQKSCRWEKTAGLYRGRGRYRASRRWNRAWRRLHWQRSGSGFVVVAVQPSMAFFSSALARSSGL